MSHVLRFDVFSFRQGYDCSAQTVLKDLPDSLSLSSAGDKRVKEMSDRDYALHRLLFTHPCDLNDDCPKKDDKVLIFNKSPTHLTLNAC